MIDRIHLAAQDPSSVVAASGILAAFNDAGVLDPLDVLSATTVARLNSETDQQVVLAAALAVRGTRYGHVCIRLSDLKEAIVVEGEEPEKIDGLPWPAPAEWEQTVTRSVLTGDGSGGHPLVWSDGRLYLERYFRYERRVAELIIGRAGADPRPVSMLSQDRLEHLLGEEQGRAALEALRGRVTVIAGGPGTGKTFTVGVMLEALAASDPDHFPLVALCAPTGKAAARLGEALAERAEESEDEAVAARLAGINPSTIHRLLGWSRERGRFARDATNRLPHDLVIVDEMSMVSLPLAAKLLQAVRDDATVVLVGDPFQLESIEAGTVLADIVGPRASAGGGSGPVAERVIVLEEGHRFKARMIARFADAVRTGAGGEAIALLEEAHDELVWVPDRAAPVFAELWETVVSQRRRLVDLAQAGDDPAEIVEVLGEIAVLCAHKRGSDGVSGWSREIEFAIDQRFPTLRWKSEWYPGRPVMITKNDYNLDLYNGDLGVAASSGDGLRAVFERGEVRSFPLSHLPEHSTVHAMTIHKSQGSQFDQVVVVLPGEGSRLLTRELLYTAVTRAESRVWLVGSEQVIRQAIARSVQRASGLGTLLWT